MISSSTDTDRINALTIEEAPFSYRQIFTARGARAVLFDLRFFTPFFSFWPGAPSVLLFCEAPAEM
jgi:hypothetical protein